MVKELREQLAAERELRNSHQKRAESLQVRFRPLETISAAHIGNGLIKMSWATLLVHYCYYVLRKVLGPAFQPCVCQQEDLFETRTARESLLSQLSETATTAETLQGVVNEQKRQLSELQVSCPR